MASDEGISEVPSDSKTLSLNRSRSDDGPRKVEPEFAALGPEMYFLILKFTFRDQNRSQRRVTSKGLWGSAMECANLPCQRGNPTTVICGRDSQGRTFSNRRSIVCVCTCTRTRELLLKNIELKMISQRQYGDEAS